MTNRTNTSNKENDPSDNPAFAVPPEEARHIRRQLLRPYLGLAALLVLGSIMLSFLTSASQVAMTPVLEIILNGAEGLTATAEVDAGATAFDLSQLGLTILNLAAQATGLTDPWSLMLVTCGTYLILAIVTETASYGIRAWVTKTRYRIGRDVGSQLFGHIIRLPLTFLNHYQAGWLQSRIIRDAEGAVQRIMSVLLDGLSSTLVSLFYAILLINTDIRLAIVAAGAGIVHLIVSRWLSKKIRIRLRADYGLSAVALAFAQERLSAVREIKALGGEQREEAAFWQKADERAHAAASWSIVKHIEAPVRFVVNRIVMIIVMLFGAWELLSGDLTTSAYLLFLFFAQSLVGPLAKLASTWISLTEIGTSLESVVFLLYQDQESGGSSPVSTEGIGESLTLRNVSFAYEDLPVLQDINLEIKKGEMIALVGRSGAGKTTLADLLLRFYDPSEGSIELDGIPIGEFNLKAYRQMFGVVSQDGMLLNDTVYNNIAYARPELARKEVSQAARVANAEEFILNGLPSGYDTLVGERGVLLSGGQRQRIAIARAIVHRPHILVLDEATSSLDTESERMVQEAIAQIVKGCTAIVIAHRLSTVRMADKIVVLKEGRIAELGKHEELLALGGEYRHLHDLQFSDIASLSA